jgi:Uma2 family endonuclease
MQSLPPSREKFYTYEDYSKFNDDKRREIINGVIYLMTAPSGKHQEISGSLFLALGNYLIGKKCRVFSAPYDVFLLKDGETKKTASNIVQPDIAVVCDKNKRNIEGCVGTPDLIVEILSPSTGSMDRVKKLNLYQEYSVLEYWIVDPHAQTIERFSFDKDACKYKQVEYFGREDTISPVIFPDLEITLEEIFLPLDEYDLE